MSSLAISSASDALSPRTPTTPSKGVSSLAKKVSPTDVLERAYATCAKHGTFDVKVVINAVPYTVRPRDSEARWIRAPDVVKPPPSLDNMAVDPIAANSPSASPVVPPIADPSSAQPAATPDADPSSAPPAASPVAPPADPSNAPPVASPADPSNAPPVAPPAAKKRSRAKRPVSAADDPSAKRHAPEPVPVAAPARTLVQHAAVIGTTFADLAPFAKRDVVESMRKAGLPFNDTDKAPDTAAMDDAALVQCLDIVARAFIRSSAFSMLVSGEVSIAVDGVDLLLTRAIAVQLARCTGDARSIALMTELFAKNNLCLTEAISAIESGKTYCPDAEKVVAVLGGLIAIFSQ